MGEVGGYTYSYMNQFMVSQVCHLCQSDDKKTLAHFPLRYGVLQMAREILTVLLRVLHETNLVTLREKHYEPFFLHQLCLNGLVYLMITSTICI